jgi:hypothetical protein
MSSAWLKSPQDVDPVSWFTGPRMPILFSIAGVLQGIAITLLNWSAWSSVVLQFIAMPFFLGAGWLTARSGQPNRPRFTFRDAAGILALACTGLVISAVGTYGGTLPAAQWWPGIALGATLVSLAPYCSARKQLICAWPLAVFVGAVGVIAFSATPEYWPLPGLILLIIGPIGIGAIAGIVFSYTVVSRTLAMLDTAAGTEEFYASAEPVDDEQWRATIARVSARVAPFLERVATAGRIEAEDRAFAAQIARRLRTELVSETTKSWLDRVASDTGMIVSDPERLADRMNESQRTALRSLLVGAFDSSVVDRHTLLIELRGQSDGSTAVALSIDIDLPEGRRLVLLAPHYLTLKTTVADLSWDDGRSLLLRFSIPPTE